MTATWATVITAGLALAAAAASWASVFQSRKQIRASLEPDIQTIIEGGQGNSHIGLMIRNTGGGTAKRLLFVATIGEDGKSIGRMGVGFLPPNYGIRIVFAYSGAELDDGDVAVVVVSSDTREFAHAWSHLSGHKVFRTRFRRRHREISAKEAFGHFFPKIDLATRDTVGFSWRVVTPDWMYRDDAQPSEPGALLSEQKSSRSQ
ncbi:MAG: hypothetical protein ACTHK3_12540 [Solirubrobacterales bacterium]